MWGGKGGFCSTHLQDSWFKNVAVNYKNIFSHFKARFHGDSETTHKRRDALKAVSRTHILLPICVGFSILLVERTANSQ